MTEWEAEKYDRVDALQKWHADTCLAHLELTGSERVLDVGCGNGKKSGVLNFYQMDVVLRPES